MGRTKVLDQGFAGLMVQFFKGGSTDVDRQTLGSGIQLAWPFRQNLEHDLTHEEYL